MSADTQTHPTPGEQSVDIRTRPPSPRRLSRNVLMAGVLCFGAIVALALLIGLSDRPSRFARPADEPTNAAGAPPETLRELPASYSRQDLAGANGEPSRDMLWGENGPPADETVSRPADSVWGEPAGPSHTGAPASSAILYRRATQRAENAASEAGDAASDADAYAGPPSQFTIQAGSVLPAALVTGLNSDLPGRVIAQITAPVFDSVTGRHLLVPQGARLIGSYRSRPSHGERRLFLDWERLILPNGASIQLADMEATDPSGASGLHDQVDHHLGALTGAIALSVLISVVANEAEDDEDIDLRPSVGDAAAQEAARSGARIVDRELEVRPTLKARPGAPVRVLVTRDLVMRPYQ